MMQITYQKRNGSIIQRYRNTVLPYKIGEETSMGWKVLNIEYKYNDKYYSEYEYNSLRNKKRQKSIKKKQIIERCTKEVKNIIYYLIAVLLLNFLKLLLGI